MRILSFTSLFPNAAQPAHGIFVYQRVAHLARRRGHQICVVAPVPYFPSWLKWKRWQGLSGIPRQETIGNLVVHHPRYLLLPKVSMLLHGALMYLGSLPLVLRLNKELKFDCVDSHYVYPDGFAAALLGKTLKLPFVVSARGTDINLFPAFRSIRPMIRWTLRRASGVIAVCSALKQSMVDLGLPSERFCVIGNGVDLGLFFPVERGQARARLGLSEKDRIIVAVGALIPRKGYQFLIPAVGRLAEAHTGLRLFIIGEGDFRSELTDMIRRENLENHIHLVGARPNEELHLWYSAADVSCLASSREGWPNVVLESLACGTPVVATGVWGVPEILVSSELGLMVEQNPGSLAAGLQAALETQWDAQRLAAYAGKRTWEVVAAEVEEYLGSRIDVSQ